MLSSAPRLLTATETCATSPTRGRRRRPNRPPPSCAGRGGGPPRGGGRRLVSADEAARTAAGDAVTYVAAAGGGGSGRRRGGGGRGTAAGVCASAGASAQTAAGDGVPDAAVGGGGEGGEEAATADEATAIEGDVACAHEAPRSSVGDVVAVLSGGEWGEEHGPPPGIARPARADEATRRPRRASPPRTSPRARPRGTSPRTRPADAPATGKERGRATQERDAARNAGGECATAAVVRQPPRSQERTAYHDPVFVLIIAFSCLT